MRTRVALFVVLLPIASLATGCNMLKREEAVRARSQKLVACLCRDDLDECVRMTDPLFVRAQGSDKVKLRFRLLSAVIKLGKLAESDVRIDQVTLGPDKKTAEVAISTRLQGEWKAGQPMKWVRVDREWYIAF